MQRIRITHTAGEIWIRELDTSPLQVGRAVYNHIVLDDAAVSAEHCVLEYDGEHLLVKDRGSANGTYLNNNRLDEPRALAEGDRLYVGPYLLELVSMAPEAQRRPRVLGPRGPMIRMTSDADARARAFAKLLRWSSEWDQLGRPRRLLLRGRELDEAIAALRAGQPAGSPLLAAFVAASRRRVLARALLLALLGVAVLGAVASLAWWKLHTADTDETPPPTLAELPAPSVTEVVPTPAPDLAVEDTWIEHTVIPAETIEDVARRYGVSVTNLARWNRLNPDEPAVEPGRTLRVLPERQPLPQQLIAYELDAASDWSTLAKRFDVPVQKLRAYNPTLGDALPAGAVVDVWIDPKPHDRRQSALKIPEFDIRPDALSVGRPNDGSLDDGIQMPPSDLYIRRAPNLMWGSSATIETLLTAIARFRQDIAFDGVLVVADISKRGGGRLPPHKSHQAGRDIDVWMPSLKGVYQKSHLGRERKPRPNEIDWFATWALIRALIESGNVAHIFIEYELQEKVYRAAKLMGATDDELTRAMQWPRGRFAGGILGHSPGHTGHIHVRMRCGPLDVRCIDDIQRNAGEDVDADD